MAEFETVKGQFAALEARMKERSEELFQMSEAMQTMVASGYEQQTGLMERFRADISQRLIKAEEQTPKLENRGWLSTGKLTTRHQQRVGQIRLQADLRRQDRVSSEVFDAEIEKLRGENERDLAVLNHDLERENRALDLKFQELQNSATNPD